MNHGESAYGLWSLVFINSAIFIMFAFSFFKPATARDWRSFGAFSAFIVALFVEMYGFPLTIYLLSGWLQARFPNLDLLSHESGHLWSTLLGDQGNPHFMTQAYWTLASAVRTGTSRCAARWTKWAVRVACRSVARLRFGPSTCVSMVASMAMMAFAA